MDSIDRLSDVCIPTRLSRSVTAVVDLPGCDAVEEDGS
jgi:hypothetical protein